MRTTLRHPITITNEQPLDMCLGHNQRNSPSGMYHYHDVSIVARVCVSSPVAIVWHAA